MNVFNDPADPPVRYTCQVCRPTCSWEGKHWNRDMEKGEDGWVCLGAY